MRYAYFIIATMFLACRSELPKEELTAPAKFSEKHRPQFHFTPPSQWMNDPNGMVYYEGEYHLFYQHYPDDNVWGPMHWGHAVSKDLIHWEHLPIALYPDDLGLIFSGGAVIDWKNTSGFGSEENPPMVAFFTHHLMEGEKAGRDDFQTQSIAYSLDKGRTWTKYEGNPVIPNPGIRDFRDPNVVWHEETQKWILVVSARDRIKFYSSKDLKSWSFESDFGPNQGSIGRPWECPDLFPITVEETGEIKWVLIVSVQSDAPNYGTGTSYFVGDFDGSTFINLDDPSNINWLDYGADNYAYVTWSDVPESDGRRLGLGWMSNWVYATSVPTTEWRSAMTLPREVSLHQMSEGYRLVQRIPNEFSSIRNKPKEVTQLTTNMLDLGSRFGRLDSLMDITMELEDFESVEFVLTNDLEEEFSIKIEANKMFVDRSRSGITDFNEHFGRMHRAPVQVGNDGLKLRVIVDLSSVEVLVNNGELALTELIFPSTPYTNVIIRAENKFLIKRLEYTGLLSIWN